MSQDSILNEEITPTQLNSQGGNKMINGTSSTNMSYMDEFADIVRMKKENLLSKGAVYAGRMEHGQWVPESLADVFKDWGVIVSFPKERSAEWQPEPVLENGFEFIGGSRNRGFYMDMSKLDEHPVLKQWWEEKGDSHLLASMFLRPGKTARKHIEVTLPKRVVDDGSADGVLAVFDQLTWVSIINAFELPNATKAVQMTVFDPSGGIVAKGIMRSVLFDFEKPTVYSDSWKLLSGGVTTFNTSCMSVLTTDDVYMPKHLSVNRQEATIAKQHGAELEPWLMDEVQRNVNNILSAKKSSPFTLPGYFNKLGLPTPDSLIADVHESIHNQLMNTVNKWPINKQYGWRGKSTASECVKDGTVHLPGTERDKGVRVGDTVFINRNPNLPSSGYVRYKVAGFVEANLAVFSALDPVWSGVLGGDHDGDDAVILYRAPFTFIPEQYTVSGGQPLDLQSMKFEARNMSNSTPEDRIARWLKEGEANIGRWDLLARYAIDLKLHNPELMEDLTKLLQLTISLKKRMGDIDEHITPRVENLRRAVGKIRKSTETYYFREYPTMKLVETTELRRALTPQGAQVIDIIQAGIEANKTGRPRFRLNLKPIMEVIDRDSQDDPEITAKAEQYYSEYLQLLVAMSEATSEEDDNNRMLLNRKLKLLTQVEMPEYAMTLTNEKWLKFNSELFKLDDDNDFHLYSVHPSILLTNLGDLYQKENTMLVGEHHLVEGDTLTIPPHTREVKLTKGELEFTMRLSNGIVDTSSTTTWTVTKVNRKSVVITPA